MLELVFTFTQANPCFHKKDTQNKQCETTLLAASKYKDIKIWEGQKNALELENLFSLSQSIYIQLDFTLPFCPFSDWKDGGLLPLSVCNIITFHNMARKIQE